MSHVNRNRLARIIPALALLVCIGLPGCLSEQQRRAEILSSIRARRANRFEQWTSERAGRPSERQVISAENLSLAESIRIAVRNSRELQIADLELQRAGATITEAWAEVMPQLDVGADYMRLDKVSSFDAGGGSIALGSRDNYTLSATVRQPLFRGGLISAGIRGARLYDLRANEQRRGVYQKVLFDVRQAYYDTRLAWELERASAAAVEAAGRLVADTRTNLEAGTAVKFDLLRAEVELKNLIAEHVRDQNSLRLAQATLLNVMGVSQESRLPELSDPLTYRAMSPTMEEAVSTAFQCHSDILQSEMSVLIQQEATTAAKAGFWPEVDATFTEGYSKPDPHDQTRIAWGEAWNAGVSLTFKLFEGFRTVARVKKEEAGLRQSMIALRDTEERVLLEVRQAILSLADAARLVESQKANVGQAEEALRLAEVGFREGVRRQIERLDARSALTRAQANYAQALYAHELARLQLERATGTLGASEPGGDD